MNFAPSDRTCSLVAGRTSVAVTTAPRRRAEGNHLKAGDADTHDEDFGCRHRARRRHHHRKGAAEFRRRIDNGAIAVKVSSAREHVHHLRAGDAWHQLHGEKADARLRDVLQGRRLAIRFGNG